MKNIYLVILSIPIFILLDSCVSYKANLIQIGDKNDAIMNAIIDFSNTSSLYKRSTVFLVNTTNLNEDLFAISIGSNNIKILLTADTKIGSKGRVPSRYFEKEGKLFIWSDENYPLKKDALAVFLKFKLIQSNEGGLIIFPDHVLDDSQKGVDYYFCKNNLLNYKKVTTNIGIGWYDMPKLNCSH